VDPDRIDFSPLDPSRDRAAWERMVRAVAARGSAARRRPSPVLAQVVAWWRPTIALAAMAALLAWAPALLHAPRPAERSVSETGADPVVSTTWWALEGKAPAAAEFVPTMGAEDAPR